MSYWVWVFNLQYCTFFSENLVQDGAISLIEPDFMTWLQLFVGNIALMMNSTANLDETRLHVFFLESNKHAYLFIYHCYAWRFILVINTRFSVSIKIGFTDISSKCLQVHLLQTNENIGSISVAMIKKVSRNKQVYLSKSQYNLFWTFLFGNMYMMTI